MNPVNYRFSNLLSKNIALSTKAFTFWHPHTCNQLFPVFKDKGKCLQNQVAVVTSVSSVHIIVDGRTGDTHAVLVQYAGDFCAVAVRFFLFYLFACHLCVIAPGGGEKLPAALLRRALLKLQSHEAIINPIKPRSGCFFKKTGPRKNQNSRPGENNFKSNTNPFVPSSLFLIPFGCLRAKCGVLCAANLPAASRRFRRTRRRCRRSGASKPAKLLAGCRGLAEAQTIFRCRKSRLLRECMLSQKSF